MSEQKLPYQSAEGVRYAYEPVLVADPADTPWPYFRGPVLARLPDDRLICSMLTGGPTEPDPDNHSMVVESRDHGVTWSKPCTFFIHRRRRCGVATVFNGFDRPVALVNTMGLDNYNLEIRTHLSWYDAPNDAWSVPATMPGCQAFKTMRGIICADGAARFPVFWGEGCEQTRPFSSGLREWDSDLKLAPSKREYRHVCGMIVSRDGGKSFAQHGYLADPNVNLWEPTLVETEPGRLTMLMRAEATGSLYRSDSPDGGVTWTPPQPTDIPSPGSKPTFLKVGDAILLFHNPNPGTEFLDRRQVEVWVSQDGLRSWTRKLPLANSSESDRPICYPDPFIDPDTGDILVALDTARKVYLLRIPGVDLGI